MRLRGFEPLRQKNILTLVAQTKAVVCATIFFISYSILLLFVLRIFVSETEDLFQVDVLLFSTFDFPVQFLIAFQLFNNIPV